MSFGQYGLNHPLFKERRRSLRKNQTDAERKLWSVLRNKHLGFRFWRQYSVGPFILDFYCPNKRLAIELDGSQHLEIKAKIYDKNRSEFLKKYNIRVMRFWNNDVLRNLEGVIEKIIQAISPPNLPLI